MLERMKFKALFFYPLVVQMGKAKKKTLFHFTQLGEHQIFPPGLCIDLPDHLCKDLRDMMYLKINNNFLKVKLDCERRQYGQVAHAGNQ